MARIFTLSTYVNKKGDARMGIMMPRSAALHIALGDVEGLELFEELRQAIKTRIDREEGAAPQDDA